MEIKLTPKEREQFNKQVMKGILRQLCKEGLITAEQLNEVLKSIEK